MPKRIKDYSTTATSYASDDYLAMDGATNGTRKILAYTVGVYPWSMNSSGVLSSTTVNTPLIQLKPALTTTECGLEWLDSTSTRAGYVKYTTNSADLLIDSGKSGGSGKIVFYTNETDCGRFTSARNFTIGVASSETGLTGAGGCIVGSTTLGTSTTTGALVVGGTIAGNKKAFIKDGLRLEQTATTVYSDITPLSNGYVEIAGTASGTANLGRITSTIVNNTAVSSCARQGGLAFDGVTSTAKVISTIGANIGTSDLTYYAEFQVPSSNPSSTIGLLQLGSVSSTHVSTSALSVFISSAGTLFFTLYGPSSTSDFIQDSIASFVSSYAGKVVSLAVVKNSTTPSLTVYVNGVVVATSSSSAGGITWGATVASTYCNIGSNGGSPYSGNILASRIFTRALSASEVVDLANKGVAEADKWASLTAKRTYDFSSTTDGWSALAPTVLTVSRDAGPTVGQTDNLKSLDTGVAGNHVVSSNDSPLVIGKKYKITYSYYWPSGNTTFNFFRLTYRDGSAILETVTPITDGAWHTRTLEFTATSTVGPGFYIYNSGGNFSFTGTSGDLFYVRGITVTEVGCLLDADLSVGVGYQVPDRSSNNYHGVVSATGTSWTLAQRRGQLRVTSNTNGNQQLLGSQVCLPTNAIITSIIGYTTGTPTIKIGNVSAGSQLVASVAMSASTYQSFTVAATTTTTGNLWVNSTTSDTINWTITYMIADP